MPQNLMFIYGDFWERTEWETVLEAAPHRLQMSNRRWNNLHRRQGF